MLSVAVIVACAANPTEKPGKPSEIQDYPPIECLRVTVTDATSMGIAFTVRNDSDTEYRYTQRYVQSHSRSPQSILERAEKWGHYRLNTKNSADARQLMLAFSADNESTASEEEQERPAADQSLSLFDAMP